MARERLSFTRAEAAVLDALRTPDRVQAFLDETPYSTEPIYRSPRSVLRDRRAHCFDGAVFAACALERHGDAPLLVDMRSERDDDHVVTVFRRRGRLGAIAQSNMVGLRYREPVYRDLRELVMSYFESYYNTDGEKSMRSYSRTLDLRSLPSPDWRFRDERMEAIAARLDRARHYPVMSRAMILALRPVDDRAYRAGLLGADEAGLYAADRLRWRHQG